MTNPQTPLKPLQLRIFEDAFKLRSLGEQLRNMRAVKPNQSITVGEAIATTTELLKAAPPDVLDMGIYDLTQVINRGLHSMQPAGLHRYIPYPVIRDYYTELSTHAKTYRIDVVAIKNLEQQVIWAAREFITQSTAKSNNKTP